MRIADSFVDELNLEAATTRRVLERVPEAHLGWQPHPKSVSLGQLALHIATLPQLVTEFAAAVTLDFASAYNGVRRIDVSVPSTCMGLRWRIRLLCNSNRMSGSTR